MIVIELIERKVGEVDSKVIPLENLDSQDLDWIKSLAGRMTDEIYTQHGQTNRVRNCDKFLLDINVVRILAITQCVLLWTIVQGNTKQRPHMKQLCAWLNETKHTHKGDLLLREREVQEVVKSDGPEVLFGTSLEEAMKTAPRGGKLVESTIDPADLVGNDMTDEDLEALFDTGCMDLHTLEKEEPPCEILLTEVVKPAFVPDFVMVERREVVDRRKEVPFDGELGLTGRRVEVDRRKNVPFEVDFEVEADDDTDIEIELALASLSATTDEKDLIEEVV